MCVATLAQSFALELGARSGAAHGHGARSGAMRGVGWKLRFLLANMRAALGAARARGEHPLTAEALTRLEEAVSTEFRKKKVKPIHNTKRRNAPLTTTEPDVWRSG